jgi:uncharacterized membrane protein
MVHFVDKFPERTWTHKSTQCTFNKRILWKMNIENEWQLCRKKSGAIVLSLTSLVFTILLILRPVIWKILTFSDINVFDFYIFSFRRSLQWSLLLLLAGVVWCLLEHSERTRVCSILCIFAWVWSFISARELLPMSHGRGSNLPIPSIGVLLVYYNSLIHIPNHYRSLLSRFMVTSRQNLMVGAL